MYTATKINTCFVTAQNKMRNITLTVMLSQPSASSGKNNMKLFLLSIAFAVLSLYIGYSFTPSVPCAGPMDPMNKECGK